MILIFQHNLKVLLKLVLNVHSFLDQ